MTIGGPSHDWGVKRVCIGTIGGRYKVVSRSTVCL